MTDRRRIALLIELPKQTAPTDPAGEQRLRRFLKALLRSYGIRCLAIRPPADTKTFGSNSGDEPRRVDTPAESHSGAGNRSGDIS